LCDASVVEETMASSDVVAGGLSHSTKSEGGGGCEDAVALVFRERKSLLCPSEDHEASSPPPPPPHSPVRLALGLGADPRWRRRWKRRKRMQRMRSLGREADLDKDATEMDGQTLILCLISSRSCRRRPPVAAPATFLAPWRRSPRSSPRCAFESRRNNEWALPGRSFVRRRTQSFKLKSVVWTPDAQLNRL